MFRRKVRSKNSFLVLNSSNRGSDIVKPDNTSLVVNESDTESDFLPRELTSILSEDDNLGDTVESCSLMKSLSQKKQSTPLRKSFSQSRSSVEKENLINKVSKSKVTQSDKIFPSLDAENITFFEEVLKACGASPLSGNSSFLMSEDQAVFSIKLNNKLKENAENLSKFVCLMKEKIKDRKYLQKMLTHTLTSENCEAARGPVQEPLIRMLLNVECLQADLIKLLVSTIADCTVENRVESENNQLVSSILCQMRFLNKINNIKIASELFEIIDAATVNVKREIIFLLPEIISEEETEEACVQLVDMLKSDENLTHVVIEALTNLPLSNSLKSQVCNKILQRLDKCPVEFLPFLVQFVLNKCHLEEFSEVINRLRNNLPFNPQHYRMKEAERQSKKKHTDEDSYVKLIFENLKFSMMASKDMTDIWFKVIHNCNSSLDFRCLDLIMLIIFYSCLNGRKSQILQLIRNKIKSEVLTQYHVESMFKVLFVIAEECSSTILEIASVLLKSFEPKLSSFGASLYKECFIHFHVYMKQIVISEILLHIGTGSAPAINTALCTLKELCRTEKEALTQYTASIMGLLVKISDLDVSQVRVLVDIIAELAFFEPSLNGTAAQDELQIFIRKQLISSKAEQCKKGVLAAVIFGKHAGKKKDSECISHTQINSVLELAVGSSATSEIKRGFFNDEFATMAKETELSKSFLEIWSKKVFDVVMENLFVKNSDLEYIDFPTSVQYSLGAEDVQKLIFPVVDIVTKSSNESSRSNLLMSVIPSTLRLFWSLEKKLDRLLPVFHASVIMPETTAYSDFSNFDKCQKKKIMDCLFLCCNYLIECVNAFCVHGIFDQAVLRLKQVIGVRKIIARYIDLIPEFVPPHCQFYITSQKVFLKKKVSENKTKKGRKRKLNELATDEASCTFLESQGERIPAEPEVKEADLCSYSHFFRELDFFTIKLLATDFKSYRNSITPCHSINPELKTCDVLFILEDLLYKSEQVLKPSEVNFTIKIKPDVKLVQKITPEEFILESLAILPELLNKIEIFSKYSENLLVSNNWNYNSRALYAEDACHVKLAMASGLKLISNIISWQGFQNSNNKLLKDYLSVLASRGNLKVSSRVEVSETSATAAAFYLAGFSKTVLTLSGGLSIVKSFQVCLNYSSSGSYNALADLCLEFLCRKWFTVAGAPDKGPVYNQHVDVLLKTYFSSVDDKLEVVRTSSQTALSEVRELTEKEPVLKTLKAINKSNFPLLYRTLCEALITTSTNEFSNACGVNEEQLHLWNKVVETLLVLVEIAKIHSSRVILASLLKRSQSIIQLFLTKGMPVIESALRVKSVEVLTLLKSFQMVTRFLHSICCHSRITNDSVVAAHVPSIRSLCERLTLEVKGMLILNGIPMDCITIAILKNRDIKGNDIISQETFSEDSDDDSRLPPEDESDGEGKASMNSSPVTQESNSEVY